MGFRAQPPPPMGQELTDSFRQAADIEASVPIGAGSVEAGCPRCRELEGQLRCRESERESAVRQMQDKEREICDLWPVILAAQEFVAAGRMETQENPGAGWDCSAGSRLGAAYRELVADVDALPKPVPPAEPKG